MKELARTNKGERESKKDKGNGEMVEYLNQESIYKSKKMGLFAEIGNTRIKVKPRKPKPISKK